ncbi:MAG: hypothetical protein QOE06_2997 [Thermoleophilaceae bacterium]|jgi:hypothetical protein|nr:hypothetical protein [Thermoleophilaceae bacterium]
MGERRRIGRVLRHPLTLSAIAGIAVIALVTSLRSGDSGTPPISGTPKEAVDVVESFRLALGARDFAKICDELYTVEARQAAGGDDCQSVLAQETAKLRDPQVKILGLSVNRAGAIVSVQASVGGQRPVKDTIRLVRQGGRFKISNAGPGGVEP